EYEDVPTVNVGEKFVSNLQATGDRCFPAITRCGDKCDTQWQVDAANQGRGEDEAPGENANHPNRSAVLGADELLRHLIDAQLNSLSGNEHFHSAAPKWV